MIASRWIIEKIIRFLKDEKRKEKRKEMDTLFGRYSDDSDLQKIKKDIDSYFKKPTEKSLNAIMKKLENLVRTRKIESSGGTRLWFGDRRRGPGKKMR